MTFDELIAHVKSEGCRIRIYKNRDYVEGSAGTFTVTEAGPIIVMATRRDTIKKKTATLLHEYGHYLQWLDGFLPAIEAVCQTYDIHWEWIHGRCELTDNEWKAARNSMLWIEWDAEVRGYIAGTELGVKFDKKSYLKGALGYMMSIKWSWENRNDWRMSIQPTHITLKNPRFLNQKKLFAPLTSSEKRLCSTHIKRVKRR